MDIQQILRWIVIAIVMIVAVVLLDSVLGLLGFMLNIALPVLLILLVTAFIHRSSGSNNNDRLIRGEFLQKKDVARGKTKPKRQEKQYHQQEEKGASVGRVAC